MNNPSTLLPLEQQQPLYLLLEERYSLEGVVETLGLALEMLFYLEEGAFSRREIQTVVCVLRDISTGLRQRDENRP